MEFLLYVIGIITLLYLYYWYHRPNNIPPGPRGLPVVGFTPFLGSRPECTAFEQSKKYGPVISVRVGREEWVFLNDYASIQQTLVKHANKFSGRPSFRFYKSISRAEGISFFDYGSGWKSQRKFGIATLRRLGAGRRGTEHKCIEELFYLNDAIRSQNGKPFDISIALHNAVANNLCNILFGRRFEYDNPEYVQILRIVVRTFDDPLFTAVSRLLLLVPQLIPVPPFSFVHKTFVKNADFVFDWITGIIDEHEKTLDGSNLRDFMDCFILEMRKNEDSLFTKLQLGEYVRDLFAAGTGTTAGALHWAILCLLHYPSSQNKLRKEIDENIGLSGTPTMEKLTKMSYANAFIQELFRYRTMSPLAVVHKATENTQLNGYSIPKGTKVFPNLWAVHNNTQFWKDPQLFVPERFLDEAGNFLSSSHVIPFSMGLRNCLGEQLARMEIFITLIGMLQKFEFVPDPTNDKLPDIENGCNNGLAFVPAPYKLIAKEL